MPTQRDSHGVPGIQPSQGRKTPTIGVLLHEIRVGTDPELREGRRLLIFIGVFLVGLGAAHVAYEVAVQEWKWVLIEVLHLFVVVVVVACLFISPTKIRHVTAFVLGALAVASLLIRSKELFEVSLDVPRLLFMATRLIGYGVVCIVLVTSDSLRAYMGHRRAVRRDKHEAREREIIRKVLAHRTDRR